MRQAAVDALGEIGGDQARASLERLADVPCLSAAVERAQKKLANQGSIEATYPAS